MTKPLTLLILFYFLTCKSYTAYSQTAAYWQQEVNFKMDVTLNDQDQTLDGFEKIQYVNHSPDTLHFIWFHLWPNAYKNDKTAFSEQLLQLNRTDFYFSNPEDRGYINRLDFRVNDMSVKTEDHPNYIDVIKVVLPHPLLPGSSIDITTPFHVKLPKNFSRGGHMGQAYQITQWYPKPAVYDRKGWHEMPYLDQGEFYSEFGNYEVKITVPENFVVAATGVLQNEEEKKWLLNRSFNASVNVAPSPAKPTTTASKTAKPSSLKTKPVQPIKNITTATVKLKTLLYQQNNVIDFAWFADKRFLVQHDTLQLPSGRIIEAFAYILPNDKAIWKNAIQYIKKAILFRSTLLGEYPYNTVTVVDAKMGFDGGMEYPTITAISHDGDEKELESTIEHEVGHNWFQAIIASNERQHPWMDEGINSYYDGRYDREVNKKADGQLYNEKFLAIQELEKKDQPIETPSEVFTENNYNLIAYYKTNKWMQLLEKELGKTVMDKAMQEYFLRWQFKHPYPGDFKKTMEDVSGKNLDNVFDLLNKTGPLPTDLKSHTTVIAIPTDAKKLINLTKNRDKNIFISPIAGINSYDKLMVGIGITNYFPPTGPVRFLLAPLYSTGAKTLTGLARLSYRWFPHSVFEKAEIFTAASKFTYDNFTDGYGEKVNIGFSKIVPGFRLTLKEKDPHSTFHKYIQWKTFLIREEFFRFKTDTVINPGTPPDTLTIDDVYKIGQSRYVNQLKLVIENNRVLYPYSAELQIDQGKGFIRTAFTGNYYFNYAQKGGANVRFFAGKFFYTGNKVQNPFDTYRYHFNMSGARGEDDYTYSNYFIGRTEQLYWRSQQMAIRDGGFKVGTELPASRVGRSDDWLMAANFTTTVPDNINPLNLFPVKIPLKVFADIGTNAAAWKKDVGETKFLYDAGLQVSLFKNVLNIYVPLLYSKVYKDYFESYKPETKFLRNISFSIDLQQIQLPKILQQSILQ